VSPLLLEIERRLSEVLGLSPERASRALSEVLDALRFDLDEYIVTRHAQLRAEGVPNTQIYDRIAAEVAGLRFCAGELSARQIRRRIYG
jgi:hypothetical protein